MKLLSALLMLLSMNFASAGELWTRYDSIFFQKYTTWVSANRVCQANGNLYANVTFDHCSGPHDTNCGPKKYAMVQPMKSTTVRCASYGRECKEWKTYPLNQGGVVNKYKYGSQIEISEDLHPKVTKYRIKDCK